MAKKTNTNTGLAVNTAKTASEAIQILQERLATLEKTSSTPFKTGNPTLPAINNNVKLQECTDVETLIKAAGNIVNAERAYNEGADAMGLQSYKAFNLSGYSAQDWLHDLKLRHAIVKQHDIETALRGRIQALQQFISKEEQFAMELQETQRLMESL